MTEGCSKPDGREVDIMNGDDVKPYCDRALKGGATGVKPIHPASVVTAPWVRLKCQFGCPGFNHSHCCPPHTPAADETRKVLDSYRRALLVHIETPGTRDRERRLKKCFQALVDLEGEMFKDGHYKAFVLLAGPCDLCRTCGKMEGTPCNQGYRARPSMEACGIDVFQTARDNGFSIQTLREEGDIRNTYCLMLVD